MRKKVSTAILVACICICHKSIAQISVTYSAKEDVFGIAIGANNTDGSRDRKAIDDCRKNGGSSSYMVTRAVPYLVNQHGSGCYAVARGKDVNGNTVVDYMDFMNSEEQAVSWVTSDITAIPKSALPSSVSIYTKGCYAEPQAQATSVGQSQKEWSEWKTDNCFKGLRYRVKHYAVYDLNQQYHYYFEFVSNYNQTVYFDFNLLDATGKVRFGNRRSIGAGEKIEFNHKMTSNYITSFITEKVCLKTDDKNYLGCDGAGNAATPNNTSVKPDAAPTASSFETDIKALAELLCKYNKMLMNNSQATAQTTALAKEIDISAEKFKAKYKNKTEKDLEDGLVEALKKLGCPFESIH